MFYRMIYLNILCKHQSTGIKINDFESSIHKKTTQTHIFLKIQEYLATFVIG